MAFECLAVGESSKMGVCCPRQSYVDLEAAMGVISLRREMWLLFLAGPARLNMANFFGKGGGRLGKGLSGRGRPRQACSGSCQTKDRPATNESKFLFWTDEEIDN